MCRLGFTELGRPIRAEAEAQLREMEEGVRLQVLVKVCNLRRAFELTPADLGLMPMPKRRGRTRKVRP
jgi:hypothetical protein